MFAFSLFFFSGAVLVTLTVAKRLEEKKRRSNVVLRAVSTGDERMRRLHHEALHAYSDGKDKFSFWFKKQLPLKAKSLANKSLSYLHSTATKHFGDIRNSRLLKKSDGLSEFFKNISEIEKGGGEINEVYEHKEEVAEIVFVPEPPMVARPAKASRKRRVKLTVTEEL